ncbi:MAG: hypothetical protein KDA79_14815 [Planctomycetaceae bacterium]|nr:hypothetical protein [Planctomycetaceae bacterium]
MYGLMEHRTMRVQLRTCVRVALLLLVAGLLSAATATPARAQGLIRSIPAEQGTWVRFEGTVRQTEIRPDATLGNLVMNWTRHLTLVALGEETAEFEGKEVPCRWIEIRSSTGKPVDEGVETGPAGLRIIQVLVPVEKIIGKAVDEAGIPVSYLPIVKGYQQVGMGEPQPIAGHAVYLSPSLTAVVPFRAPEAGSEESVDTPAGQFTATPELATEILESRETRITQRGTLWASSEVPFGLVKWEMTTSMQSKLASEPRDSFQDRTEVEVKMSLHATGDGEEGQLVIP